MARKALVSSYEITDTPLLCMDSEGDDAPSRPVTNMKIVNEGTTTVYISSDADVDDDTGFPIPPSTSPECYLIDLGAFVGDFYAVTASGTAKLKVLRLR